MKTIMKAPGAGAILKAYHRATAAAADAVQSALICGQLLIEQKEAVGHGKWITWLEENCGEIDARTAQRWMGLAERVPALAFGKKAPTVPVSTLLLSAPADLTEGDQECKQLLLDFTANKTIRECLAGVVVEGDETTRLVRAANGRGAEGAGHNGEDRKDYAGFAGRNLQKLARNCGAKLTEVQKAAVIAAFEEFAGKSPAWLVIAVGEIFGKEAKMRR